MNRLKAPDFTAAQHLGTAVSISGDRLAAGAPAARSPQDEGLYRSGAVYIYSLEAGQWLPKARLEAGVGPEHTVSSFGNSVALLEDRLLVGTRDKNFPAGEVAEGSVYVFSLEAGTWIQKARLAPPGLEPTDHFSRAIGLWGDTVVAGCQAYRSTTAAGVPPGPVSVYDWNRITAAPVPAAEDTDGDGMPDYMETYFGTRADTPGAAPLSVDFADGMLLLTWPKAEANGVEVTPEWSPDLLTWLAGGEEAEGIEPLEILTALTGPGERRASAEVSGRARIWMRLRVTRTAPETP